MSPFALTSLPLSKASFSALSTGLSSGLSFSPSLPARSSPSDLAIDFPSSVVSIPTVFSAFLESLFSLSVTNASTLSPFLSLTTGMINLSPSVLTSWSPTFQVPSTCFSATTGVPSFTFTVILSTFS